MNRVAKNQQGFTIIELSLAMAFIAFLLLAIALAIIQIGSIYSQGLTLKEVNQASRDINDDIRRNVTVASQLNLGEDYVATAGNAGGRLCFGQYSYVWNYAKAIAENNPNVAKLKGEAVRFIRVADPDGAYCQKNDGVLINKDIRGDDESNARELLQPGDHNLGIHQFMINTPPASAIDAASHQQLYSFQYVIGTSKIEALNSTQTACLAPNEDKADPLFCTVQPFSLVIRAGSGVN